MINIMHLDVRCFTYIFEAKLKKVKLIDILF